MEASNRPMSAMGVCVLGAGSLRCAPPIVASLASYFGERPLAVAFYDADPERLELFERLAGVCFALTKATHSLETFESPEDALAHADRVILALDEHCACRFLGRNAEQANARPDGIVSEALTRILAFAPQSAAVLSLLGADVPVPLANYHRLDWPEEPSDEERSSLPHQVLRWIKADDYMHDFVARFERSPLKAWLDDVRAAESVSGSQQNDRPE